MQSMFNIFKLFFNNHNAYKGTVVHKKGNLKMLHKLYKLDNVSFFITR